MKLTSIPGGVTAAKGYRASGEHLGMRKNKLKRDVALIVSEVPANAACCYTTNLVQGAPITVTKRHMQNGRAQAVICNSGNANTYNWNGIEIADGMCKLVSERCGVAEDDVIVASTGVIGQEMTMEPFEQGIGMLADSLAADLQGGMHAAEAIMTTDTVRKESAYSFVLDGKEIHMGGMSKGSGMIHPNMATMLCFVTTDAAISQPALQKALSAVVPETFNMLSIDGDTSTNDMVTVLANGLSGNAEIGMEGEGYAAFEGALMQIFTDLCRMMAKDGEGASKLVTCIVTGAADEKAAKLAARGVISSNLVKAMMFGADANCGRVACAIGYSGADVDVHKLDISFRSAAGELTTCKGGFGLAFDEAVAKKVLSEDEVDILVELHAGQATATAWGCDLTYDYVKINGDYRT